MAQIQNSISIGSIPEQNSGLDIGSRNKWQRLNSNSENFILLYLCFILYYTVLSDIYAMFTISEWYCGIRKQKAKKNKWGFFSFLILILKL